MVITVILAILTVVIIFCLLTKTDSKAAKLKTKIEHEFTQIKPHRNPHSLQETTILANIKNALSN